LFFRFCNINFLYSDLTLAKEEIEIISQIKSGDKEAFKRFIGQYQKFVVNVCYKFVNDADDANDIAQEVFIDVYKTIDKFRNEAKISTWLYRISVNRSLNFLRDYKKHRETESYSEEPGKIVGAFSEADDTPESSYLNQERREILNKAINSLPERQKTVFILNKKEALSAEEIGKVLGLSLKAVESLIVRAKLNLQKMLLNYYKQ